MFDPGQPVRMKEGVTLLGRVTKASRTEHNETVHIQVNLTLPDGKTSVLGISFNDIDQKDFDLLFEVIK